MKITAFGCSLTHGSELRDNPGNQSFTAPSLLVWPALVASDIGAEYRCRAKGGSGNLCIADRVLRRRFNHPENFFIINWTFIDRFDYSDPVGQHAVDGNDYSDYFTTRPGESDDISVFYYKSLHSEYRDKITSLMYIKMVLDHLIFMRARFMMTCVDSTLFCQKWHAPPHVLELQEAIRPYIHDFEGRNFLDWSRHRGFKISPAGHPLEEAHAAAAELMLPVIDTILRKA